MDQDLQEILNRVAELGEMSEAEARRVVKEVYEDGIVSRGEAEALFRVNETLRAADPEWGARFIGAVKDFVLTREAPLGWVTDEESNWLIAQITQGGSRPSEDEIELLLLILRYAEGAPLALSRFTLSALSGVIVDDGRVSTERTEQLRRALYATSGEAGIWVNRHEATALFEINDAVAFAKNDPSWNDLFARAVGNHLMARAHPNPQTEEDALSREAWLKNTSGAEGFLSKIAGTFTDGSWFSKVSYSSQKAEKARQIAREVAMREAETVTADEDAWFMRRLGRDEKVSAAERALVDFLKAEAPGFAHGLAAVA